MSPRRARAVRGHLDPDPARALRRHLIDVTQRLLAAHGLGTLTTREIARAAEVSDGVLYNHFADKDELILAALGEQFTELVEQFRQAMPIPGTGTVESNLLAVARACTTFQTGALPLLGALLGRMELLNRFLDAVHSGESGPQQIFTGIAQYISAEQELGRATREVEAISVAALLFGACQIRVLGSHLGQLPADDTHADVDSMVAVLLRSLR